MKYRNLILSVLFWVVASISMAVTLPSSSYNFYESYNTGNEGFTLSLGTTFVNHSTLGVSAYTGSCTSDEVWTGDVSVCEDCCAQEFKQCMANGGTYQNCKEQRGYCDTECGYKALNQQTPAGEALLLIPFALAYALVRRRRQASEVA